jgi:hypothetical protein
VADFARGYFVMQRLRVHAQHGSPVVNRARGLGNRRQR